MTSFSENEIFLIAGVVAILIIGLILYFIKKQRRHHTVLIMGLTNSGKTVLFSDLLYNKLVTTYTSMVENIGMYKEGKHTIQIIDIPGNERIRKKLFDKYKNTTEAILFLIDSETVQSELRDVAELLYNLLTDPIVRSTCKEVLISCNKQDLPLAKGPAVVQMLLQKELNTLRGLKSKQLESTNNEGGSKRKPPFLGSRKKDFEFAHLKPLFVSFAESVTYNMEEDGLQVEEIKKWLKKF